MDTNETYYEVPHWMHLSFVNYDREEKQKDGHSKPENSSNTASNLLDPYEIGPNGFIRPKIDPDSLSNVKEIKSFSALGNMAATPGIAKLKHERQLISDRDFRDILEACKPRISGTRMPSALASLLILHQLAVDTEKARSTGVKLKAKKQPRAKDLPLREWGTVDFGESYTVQPKYKSNRSSSPSVRRVSPEFLEKSEGCESVGSNSNSSGFASHVSSMFSNSYDRVLWDNYESPSTVKNVVQIQRSNSIDFNQLSTSLPVPVDSDTALSEESMSLCTDTASRSSGGKGSSGMEGEWAGDNDTTASRQSKSEKHAETLRRMMEAHDITSCGILSSQVDGAEETNLVRPGSTHPSDPELNTSKSGSLSQTM